MKFQLSTQYIVRHFSYNPAFLKNKLLLWDNFRLNKKLQRNYRELSYSLHPASPNVTRLYLNILQNEGINFGIILLAKLQISPVFPLRSFFCPGIPHSTQLSCLLSLINSVTLSLTFHNRSSSKEQWIGILQNIFWAFVCLLASILFVNLLKLKFF